MSGCVQPSDRCDMPFLESLTWWMAASSFCTAVALWSERLSTECLLTQRHSASHVVWTTLREDPGSSPCGRMTLLTINHLTKSLLSAAHLVSHSGIWGCSSSSTPTIFNSSFPTKPFRHSRCPDSRRFGKVRPAGYIRPAHHFTFKHVDASTLVEIACESDNLSLPYCWFRTFLLHFV